MTVKDMIPEYKHGLDQLRQRRQELLAERRTESSFERRHCLTVRVYQLNQLIESTSAALHDMMEYDHG